MLHLFSFQNQIISIGANIIAYIFHFVNTLMNIFLKMVIICSLGIEKGTVQVICAIPYFVLEVFSFTRTVFTLADIVFYRSIIDLGRCIVLERIRLTTDLWFVFRKALIAFVNALDGVFFSFGNDFFHELGAVFRNRFLNYGCFILFPFGRCFCLRHLAHKRRFCGLFALFGTCSTVVVIAVCGVFSAITCG